MQTKSVFSRKRRSSSMPPSAHAHVNKNVIAAISTPPMTKRTAVPGAKAEISRAVHHTDDAVPSTAIAPAKAVQKGNFAGARAHNI